MMGRGLGQCCRSGEELSLVLQEPNSVHGPRLTPTMLYRASLLCPLSHREYSAFKSGDSLLGPVSKCEAVGGPGPCAHPEGLDGIPKRLLL